MWYVFISVCSEPSSECVLSVYLLTSLSLSTFFYELYGLEPQTSDLFVMCNASPEMIKTQ